MRLCAQHAHSQKKILEHQQREETVFTPVSVPCGSDKTKYFTQAQLDSGALSIWMSLQIFKAFGGHSIIEDIYRAHGADGTPLVGSNQVGTVTFRIGAFTYTERVRILDNLPAEILIGRQFMTTHKWDIRFSDLTTRVRRGLRWLFVPFWRPPDESFQPVILGGEAKDSENLHKLDQG